MRKKERAITEISDIINIMKNCDVCSVAFMDGDYPYVIPLNFGVEETDGIVSLYFHGAGEGTKIDLLKENNRVSFCVTTGEALEMHPSACSATMRYSSVCGRGRIEILKEHADRLRGMACIMNQYDKSGRTEYDFDGRVMEKTVVLKITAEQIIGKSNKRSE